MSENPKNHRMQDILLYEQNLLEDDERKELEEHLKDCAACQATVVTVKKYLPMLHEALKPNELPPEVLLARVKAQMREKDRAKELASNAQPAGFFTRMRVAMVGFALAGVAAIVIAIEALLPSLEPALVAKSGADAGAPARGGYVAAPRPPGWDSESDGGEDAGHLEKKIGDPPP